MGRPKSEMPLLTILYDGLRLYFNSAAIELCKINDNTYFEIIRKSDKKKQMTIKFNKKGNGYKCGKPTVSRQSQLGGLTLFQEIGIQPVNGKHVMKKSKKKKGCWNIRMI